MTFSNCSDGYDWQLEKLAVTRILLKNVNGDSGWCTGSLINNTSTVRTPYILTACHCLGGYDAAALNNLSQWIFYWQYEFPGCVKTTEPPLRSTTGAYLRANNTDSDFALLELQQDPKSLTGVFPYYLGWDRSGNAGTPGRGIHHPDGDTKRINKMYSVTTYPYSISWSGGTTTPSNSHWDAYISDGGTQGGSSGSPLINDNRKIIGQLHGGNGDCAPVNKYYGKFDISWTGNGSTSVLRRLSDWLNPAGGTAPQTLDGTLAQSVTLPVLSGPSTICTSNSTFTISNLPSGATIVWSYDSSKLNFSSSGGTATLSAKSGSAGSSFISASINGYLVRKEVIVNFPTDVIIQNIPVTVNTNYYLYPQFNFPYITGFNFVWATSYSNVSLTSMNNYAIVYFTQPGGYTLYAQIKTNCGTSTVNNGIYNFVVTRSSPGNPVVFPNPASDILKIDIDAFISSQPQSGQFQQKPTAYDIRLYDSNGYMYEQTKAKSGIVEFRVSNLSDGIYYVHIIDGVSAKPETYPVIIKH